MLWDHSFGERQWVSLGFMMATATEGTFGHHIAEVGSKLCYGLPSVMPATSA